MGKISKTFGVIALAGAASASQAGEFDGWYTGAYGRARLPIDVSVGAFAGYNFPIGENVVAGAELEADYDWNSVWGGSDATGTLNARLGYDMGSALLYGRAGAGYSTTGSTVWTAGIGIDYAVTERVFVRGEGGLTDPLAAGLQTRYTGKVGLGVKF